jgi:hypothetical protein
MLKIEITNDQTGSDNIANYDYKVFINGIMIDSGKVLDHNRSLGWRSLLVQAAHDSKLNEMMVTHFADDN